MNRNTLNNKALNRSNHKINSMVTENLNRLVKHVTVAAVNYHRQREQYYEAAHQYHQTEQNYLKLKRQLSQMMHEQELQQFVTEENTTVHLTKGQAKCKIYDEQAIPSKFTSVHRVIDTAKLKAALIRGEEVPGVFLETQGFDVIFKLNS